MKEKLKKGFTIVELVIVIAVIAILAAVLIPTFSSITNSAKESAAYQQARNGMESVLVLTQATMPEDTKFYVVEDTGATENKYAYVYSGNKLQADASDGKLASPATKEGEYYIYISPKAITNGGYDADKGTVATGTKTIDENMAKRIASAMGANYSAPVLTLDAGKDYIAGTIAGKTVRLYWTSDIETTLLVFLGGGKKAEVTETKVNDSLDAAVNNVGADLDVTAIKIGNQEINKVATEYVVGDTGLVFAVAYKTPVADSTTVTVKYTVGGVEQTDIVLTGAEQAGSFTIAKANATGAIVITSIVITVA